MSYQEIVVLHPGHGLEDFPTDLPDEKAVGLLNAFAVAWHPALLAAVKTLPRAHRADQPPTLLSERLIIVPPASEEFLPSDWIGQARTEGATVIAALSSRDELTAEIVGTLDIPASLDADLIADFFALGTCRLLLELLTRRMHHFGEMDEGHLEREAVAAAQAVLEADTVAAKARLRASFELLTEARERFYPVECYLLDLCLVIPRLADAHLSRLLANSNPVNVLTTAADAETMIREHPELREQFQTGVEQGRVDLVGGEWQERPVPLLPLTSMLREFEKGYDAFQRSLGLVPATWGRRRYGFSTLLPQIVHRFGARGALHLALDDGIYPDAEQSKIRWEGCDGTAVDATTRIPLAADSASSFLRFPTRMAESMQQDQTAAILWARWPEIRVPFWQDLERIHAYSPVLGRFVTFRQFFDHTEDPGRLSKFEEREYLSPFLIQAVAAEEPDAIGRFLRHFQRRAKFDAGDFLDGLAALLCGELIPRTRTAGEPIEGELNAVEAADSLEERLERSGPDLPAGEGTSAVGIAPFSDAELDAFVVRSARRLGDVVLRGASGGAGYLVLNPLSFARTVTVEVPKIESPPAVKLPIRGVQFDGAHRHITVDLPPCGYTWIPSLGPKAERQKGGAFAMAEGAMIRNEFIEVYVNDETGGIGRIKQFGRKPNRLSQQIAFRFPRERTIAPSDEKSGEPNRTFYSLMRCTSLKVTANGPGLGEIATAGTLIDPEEGSTLAEYSQTIRVWRGRPIIELEIELRPVRLPSGDPWSNYFASRFAWNDSAATLTRSVLGGAHGFQLERFESPHFFEIATESQRTTILNQGLPFHRKTGMRMVDSILIVAGESARQFRFGIAINADYPMQPAMDVLVPPVVLESAAGPPPAGQSGWLFHVSAKNVQILEILPLLAEQSDADEPPAAWRAPHDNSSSAGFGFALRLVETEGRHRAVQVRCFRTPSTARQRDFRGRTISSLKIVDDAVHLEMTGYEIVDVEFRFGEVDRAVTV